MLEDDVYWEIDRQNHEPLDLPHLDGLTLRLESTFEMQKLLRLLKTPKVESLELLFADLSREEWEEDWEYHFLNVLAAFCAASSFSLQHLTIRNAPMAIWPGTFPSFPALRTLRIYESRHCRNVEHDDTWIFEEPETFLPLLEELEWKTAGRESCYAPALRGARFRGPLTRLSLPTTGPRTLRRITITDLEGARELPPDCVYALPSSWGRRIQEFAAHGLEIHFDPFRMSIHDRQDDRDEYADTWPEDPDGASEPHELDKLRRHG
ncbi:hypothetical protein C8R43DRAFT_1132333 [Mycena crocata]|nr:hypothetical protein C8R43DRAFT_1132333 [Mycena crocata]